MIPLCLRTARSNGHSDNFLLIFSKPLGLGILDTEGTKK